MSKRSLLLAFVTAAAGGCGVDPRIDTINGEIQVLCGGPLCDEGAVAVGGTYILEVPLQATRADVPALSVGVLNSNGSYFRRVEDWLEEGNELPEGVFDPTLPYDGDNPKLGGRTLKADVPIDYPVIYTPPEAGFHQARLSIDGTARNTIRGPITIDIRAQAALPEISIYPTTVDFGSVEVGDTGIAEIFVDNNSPLDASISYRLSQGNLYFSPDADPFFVAGGDRKRFQIEYEPRNDDPQTGTDNVVFSLGDTPIQRVNLRANDCENGVPSAYDRDRDGYTTCGGDCDDDNADANPGGTEVADNVDNDCNDLVDDTTRGYDDDEDGYCEHPSSCIDPGVMPGDCNDGDARQSPAPKNDEDDCPNDDVICNDGIDNDCDGQVDGGTSDLDGDGYTEPADCEEGNSQRFPGARELPNLVDDDCDSVVDEGTKLRDDDGDGYCEGVLYPEDTNDPLLVNLCANNRYEGVGDCDDSTAEVVIPGVGNVVTGPDVFPGASESLTRGIDNDCDGLIDEGTIWGDDDEDGMTEEGGDCDDDDPGRNPGVYDIPGNGIDEDCDPATGP